MGKTNIAILAERKFGTSRGFVSRAAKALDVNQGNLSKMLKGDINTPQKYIDRLSALPDHIDPVGVIISEEDGYFVKRFSCEINTAIETDLDFCARVLSPPSYDVPDFSADPAATQKFFGMMVQAFKLHLRDTRGRDFMRALDALKIDTDKSAAKLAEELKRKFAEIGDDNEDPLT